MHQFRAGLHGDLLAYLAGLQCEIDAGVLLSDERVFLLHLRAEPLLFNLNGVNAGNDLNDAVRADPLVWSPELPPRSRVLVAVTVAPATTAPWESVTTPLMLAWPVWASTLDVPTMPNSAASTNKKIFAANVEFASFFVDGIM